MRKKLPQRKEANPRKMFRWNSLWVSMAAVTLGLSLAAVLVVIQVVYRYANNAINQSIEQNNAQIVANVSASIDSYLQEMISVSDTVTGLLSSGAASGLTNRPLVFLREDIETLAVFDESGAPVLVTDNRPLRKDLQLTRQTWFAGGNASEGGYMVSQPHVQRLYRGVYPWVITLTRGVSWTENGTQRSGLIMVDMNFSRIKDLCSRDLENDGYLYITDSQGNVVYHPRQQMIYAGILPQEVTRTAELPEGSSVLKDNNRHLAVCVQTLDNTAWRIIGVASRNGLANYTKGPGQTVIAAVLFLAVAVLLGSLWLSRLIVQPLYRLMHLMNRAWEDTGVPPASETGIYEAQQLGMSFNRMVERIRQLMEQVRAEQKQLHRSEVKALIAQINPHFLYNTLDSVIWLAESGDQKNVIRMVLALSKYFRLSLSGARDFITVADELLQVENYLIIQKMRFGDAFTYEITCEEAVRCAQVPKILLQPLAENAIVHGLGTLGEGGVLRIAAAQSENGLEMTVSDNGCGIKPEVLEHILQAKGSGSAGIGLKNVQQRIGLLCGAAYGLSVESELDEGTTVHVHLPFWPQVPEKEKKQ